MGGKMQNRIVGYPGDNIKIQRHTAMGGKIVTVLGKVNDYQMIVQYSDHAKALVSMADWGLIPYVDMEVWHETNYCEIL